MRVLATANQKRVVMIERKFAAAIRALQHSECNAHATTSLTDFQIVESHLTWSAVIKSDQPLAKVGFVHD